MFFLLILDMHFYYYQLSLLHETYEYKPVFLFLSSSIAHLHIFCMFSHSPLTLYSLTLSYFLSSIHSLCRFDSVGPSYDDYWLMTV